MNEPSQSSAPVLFDDVAEQFLAELRAGKYPSIQGYADRYPALAEQIQELFPVLFELESNQESTTTGNSGASNETPDQIGDYRVIREIGRGGMGVVYEARHQVLDRQVALKVLPKTFSSRPHFLDRFMREARAAGRLHHTNIVPLFEVGEDNGLHFYAMQFIHGQNLDMVIRELRRVSGKPVRTAANSITCEPGSETLALTAWNNSTNPGDAHSQSFRIENLGCKESGPSSESAELSRVGQANDSYFRRVARVGIQVAEALDFANNHGWLHRDIKPSNLLLDTDGVVWITDFGLAKADGEDLTHTGDVVGTLRYMAPERFKGVADSRSDQYSLGLTLYELCTLEPAFDSNDRANLIDQIMNHPPTALHRLRHEIPRDLETVIVKSMARDSESRYASNSDLAADLRRFVAGKPVVARRSSVHERLWRWAKRHPSQAALALTLFLLALTVTLGSMYFGYQERNHAKLLKIENEKAWTAEKKARREAERAKRARLGSQAHLFWSHYRAGQALRSTGVPGQRDLSLNELSSAYRVLPKLGLSAAKQRARELAVRSEATAALANWELTETRKFAMEDDPAWPFDVNTRSQRTARTFQSGRIEVRDRVSEEIICQLDGKQTCWTCRFSDSGNFLATRHHPGSRPQDQRLFLWDVRLGKAVLELGPEIHVSSFAISHDEQFLATGTRQGVSIYRISDGSLAKTIQFDGGLTRPVSSFPLMKFVRDDSQLILVSKPDDTIRFVDVKTGLVKQSVQSSGRVYSFDFNPRTNRLVAGGQRLLTIWDLDGPRKQELRIEKRDSGDVATDESASLPEPIRIVAHGSNIIATCFDETGRWLTTCGWDNATRVFDLELNEQVIELLGKRLVGSGFSADGRELMVISGTNQTSLFELENPGVFSQYKLPKTNRPQRIRFVSGRSQTLLYLTDAGVQFFDHTLGYQVGFLPGDFGDIYVSRDGKTLYTASKTHGAQSWPLSFESGSVLVGESATIDKNPCTWISLSNDDRKIVLRDLKSGARVLDMDTGSVVVLGQHSRMNLAKIDPTGKRVVTTTWRGSGIKVWDAETGQLIKALEEDLNTAFVEFSPDGSRLATSTKERQAIWDLETLDKLHAIEIGQADGIFGTVDWARSGKLICTSYTSYQPQLVDGETGKTVTVLDTGDSLRTGQFRFSDDDRYLAVVKSDRLQVWDLEKTRQRLGDLGMAWD